MQPIRQARQAAGRTRAALMAASSQALRNLCCFKMVLLTNLSVTGHRANPNDKTQHPAPPLLEAAVFPSKGTRHFLEGFRWEEDKNRAKATAKDQLKGHPGTQTCRHCSCGPSPVNTTFPDTKIRSTILGLIIL